MVFRVKGLRGPQLWLMFQLVRKGQHAWSAYVGRISVVKVRGAKRPRCVVHCEFEICLITVKVPRATGLAHVPIWLA